MGDNSSSEAESGELEEPEVVSRTSVKLPDIGIINSCYTLTLFGQSQEVRLYSWCTHDRRTQAAKSMELEPGVWYSVKLTVVPDKEAGVSHVRGKVWKRDESEPTDWLFELVDEAPNYSGAPGLFGNSKDAEAYVDNLFVTPNE